MRLPRDTSKNHGKSSSSPGLFHALVGASINSTIAPIGFRVASDTNPLLRGVTTMQIRSPDTGKGFDHDDRRHLEWTDTPTQSFSETEEPGFSRTTTLVDSDVDTQSPNTRHKPSTLPFEKRSTDDTRRGTEPSSNAGQVDLISAAGSGSKILLNIAKESADAFGPLKSVLGGICAIYDQYEKTVSVRNKIEVLLSRVETVEKLLGSSTGDRGEGKRRSNFLSKLDQIEVQLRSLYDKGVFLRFAQQAEDDGAVTKLLEDLREAISDYQMAQQIAIADQSSRLIDAADLAVLNSCKRAGGSEYRHGKLNSCLRGTREAALDEIELWTKDSRKSPVFWLNGLAGTGKSTIAKTVAERTFADGRLGASFFCSRDFEDRSDLRFIFPTLAFQLAHKYPQLRPSIVSLLRSNPGVFYESLYSQMEQLIVRPLESEDLSTVIVIDALDECKDEEPASAILSVLGRLVGRVPTVKFFVTGRPEPRIQTGFRLPLLRDLTDVFVLHNVEPAIINNDIRLFFKHGLSELATRHGIKNEGGWPTQEHLDLLCRRAGGLFVYAVATLKFLDHGFKRPDRRLDIIVKFPEDTAHEGKAKLPENVTLDSLYSSIFQATFRENDADDDAVVRSVLGAVVLVTYPLSPSAIAKLLDKDADEVFSLLMSVRSLLALREDPEYPVRPFHKSFPDFITDSTRCLGKRFFISHPDHHTELTLRCLTLMNQNLEKNMCSIPDYALNSEVEDLPMKIRGRIGEPLGYACRSWYKHLVLADRQTQAVASVLRQFLEDKFLFWLQVLSLLGAVGNAARALDATTKWLSEIKSSADIEPLLDTAADCFHFVTEFFEVISMSATHIYNSALALTPKSSIVRKLYGRFVHPSPRVVIGLPASWDPRTASVVLSTQHPDTTWSPCGRFIAVSTNTGVEFRDSTTLKKLSALESPANLSQSVVVIAYSPNGRFLACACTRPFSFEMAIVIWDTQTGGIVKTIHGGEPGYPRSMLYSSDGRMLSVSCGKSPYKWTVWTFDTASGERGCSDELESEFDPVLWTEKNSIRFATSYHDDDNFCIDIWEITSVSNDHPTKVNSFRTCHGFNSNNCQIFFSPASLRVAILSVKSTIIRDARESRLLLEASASRTLGSYAGHFSPDGNLFACTEQNEVQIWKASTKDYVLWAKFPLRFSAAAGGAFAFSPDSGSVIGWGLGIMEVWKLNQPVKSLASEQSSDVWNSHLVAFSTNGTHVAIGRASSGNVMVVDLHTGAPELIISTDMRIVDIKMAGDTVFALAGMKIVSWSLTGGSREQERHDPRLAGLDESLKIVEMLYEDEDNDLDPRLLDDQCQKAVLTLNDHMFLYDVDNGACLGGVYLSSRFRDFRFSPDGRQLWVSFVYSKYDGYYEEAGESEADGSGEGNESEADSGGEGNENEVDGGDDGDENKADDGDEGDQNKAGVDDEGNGDEADVCNEGDQNEADVSGEGNVNEADVGDGGDRGDENEADSSEEGAEDEADSGDEADGNEGESESETGEGEDASDILDDEESQPEVGYGIVDHVDQEAGQLVLVNLPDDAQPPDRPWESSKGYKIDGLSIQWVLDREGKRLLWLPPHWRTTNEETWRWNGDFLVLRKSTLPEPVIVQLSSVSELVPS